MHEKGVFNLDMNPGNVFFYKSGEKYRFALIDINRIRFCRHLTRNDCVEVSNIWTTFRLRPSRSYWSAMPNCANGIPKFCAEPSCCGRASICLAASNGLPVPVVASGPAEIALLLIPKSLGFEPDLAAVGRYEIGSRISAVICPITSTPPMRITRSCRASGTVNSNS